MNILVIAAHPDDEVLGCGATIEKFAHQGHQVYIGILGEGLTSREMNRELVPQSKLDELKSCAEKAAKCLGAKQLFTFDFPDNRFDNAPLLEIIKTVEELIKKTAPDIIFTHHAGDLNIDHQITNRAVLTATRPTENQKVMDLYTFEIPSSSEWAFQSVGTTFRPNVFFEVSENLPTKIKALNFYDTEVRPFPHPRSPKALEAIAMRWASVSGLKAAEAFELVRSIRKEI